MFSAVASSDQNKGLMTLDSLVNHSGRLDLRHWKHGCHRLTVCSVVWPGRWLWRTEAHRDDLLTDSDCLICRWSHTLWVLSVRSTRKVVSWSASYKPSATQNDASSTRRTRRYACCRTTCSTACALPSTYWHWRTTRRCCTRDALWCTSSVRSYALAARCRTRTTSSTCDSVRASCSLGHTGRLAASSSMDTSTGTEVRPCSPPHPLPLLPTVGLRRHLLADTFPQARLHVENRCSPSSSSSWVESRSCRSCSRFCAWGVSNRSNRCYQKRFCVFYKCLKTFFMFFIWVCFSLLKTGNTKLKICCSFHWQIALSFFFSVYRPVLAGHHCSMWLFWLWHCQWLRFWALICCTLSWTRSLTLVLLCMFFTFLYIKVENGFKFGVFF